jgi:hypothetical protein
MDEVTPLEYLIILREQALSVSAETLDVYGLESKDFDFILALQSLDEDELVKHPLIKLIVAGFYAQQTIGIELSTYSIGSLFGYVVGMKENISYNDDDWNNLLENL